jgi:hypothetical protein
MNELNTDVPVRGGRMRIPRSRGAASGFLLILLGVWGALIPFVGPYFDFAWGDEQAWWWTSARGWLEVLPGAATVIGGLLLLSSRNRAAAMLGGWISVLAGAWFVVGRAFAEVFAIGDVGRPLASTGAKFGALDIAYFSGVGALIVFLGALALGRLSVRSLRDIQYAQRPIAAAEPASATPAAVHPTTGPVPVAPHPTAPPMEPTTGPVPEAESPSGRIAGTEPVTEPVAPRRRGLRGLFSRRGAARHRDFTTTTPR